MEKKKTPFYKSALFTLSILAITGCKNENNSSQTEGAPEDTTNLSNDTLPKFASEPLVTDNYTADPSAHVFDGKIYIYPSHDWDSGIPEDDTGAHFDMKDYHVYSMDSIGGKVTDHGVVLDVKDVAWAKRQMWAPDAAEKNGKYYLYFPAKDEKDIFRIGVATSDSPAGPFTAQKEPIAKSYSIDPAVYKDTDGKYYMYLGGIWGGQLQRYRNNEYQGEEDVYPADDEPALSPKVARMSDDMLGFAEELRDVQILDKDGNPLSTGDNERRFFEAAWVHKYNDTYYFSYSTGDTHNIAYATKRQPLWPIYLSGGNIRTRAWLDQSPFNCRI
ncbi:family 43 glycosylhydrolase [Antarcticibacterium sp. 1MA-6-2]|uniref:family 43 glycosylhydrolase n=1 Tax=Antarcticibacterium sp. 1MA-6-2 TaxID=2908210 RepID=UPI0028832ADC|nr:family 43 glycosylhydrolase [Antarcticibacterium sp. 1MA-6-2]